MKFSINESLFIIILLYNNYIKCKSQDFCKTNDINGAFNSGKDRIQVISNQSVWTYNNGVMSLSNKENNLTDGNKALKVKVFIPQINGCVDECADIVIAIYRMSDNNNLYYNINLLSNGKILTDKPLPIFLSEDPLDNEGYIINHMFWPTEWTSHYSNDIAMAYNPSNFTLFAVINRKSGKSVLKSRIINATKWTKCAEIDNSINYNGMFYKDKAIYVIGFDKKNDSKVYVWSDKHFRYTGKDVKQFFGCDSSESKSNVILIVIVLIVVIMLISFAVFIICFTRKKAAKKSSKRSNTKKKLHKSKTISKSKSKSKFGDIDSKLNLNVKISDVSIETIHKPEKAEIKTPSKESYVVTSKELIQPK